MIIVKLQGGLGNQMFQYTAARCLLKNKKKLYLDHQFLDANTSDSEHFNARCYELHIFKNLKAVKATAFELSLFKSQSIFFNILRFLLKSSIKYVQEIDSRYISLSDVPANTYLEGYFQSESYFKKHREIILKEFKFPSLDPINEALKNTIIACANAVSIHIRRGDYLKSKNVFDTHGILPLTYYKKALDILKDKHPVISLFIFSDDMNWVKGNLKVDNFKIYYIDNNSIGDSWKDMALMSYCKHHIIANSSFSWWGAWLNQYAEKIVIAPARWFADGNVHAFENDIVPDSWIRI